MIIRKVATWIPVTTEMLEDATDLKRLLFAVVEYSGSAAESAPLTARERISGIRVYVASNGYELHRRVGWREVMYRALEAIRRERYPEDYGEPYDD